MKAIIMIRTSTISQEVETQRVEVSNYAIRDGYDPSNLIVIGDKGASAIKLDDLYMFNLESMFKQIEDDGDINCVYAFAIDRLGRNEEILFKIKNFLIQRKVNLKIMNPQLQLLNNDGSLNGGMELAFSLFATLSKQEMEAKKARFKRGKERNKQNNKYNGGNIQFGYMVDKDGYIVPNEEELSLVRYIYSLYASDCTQNDITMRLRNENKTIRGLKARPDFIHKTLSNPLFFNNGIIDQETYDKVLERKKANKLNRCNQSRHIHLATKILKCPICGANFTHNTDRYMCYTHKRQRFLDKECNNSYCMKAHILDGILWYQAKELYKDMLKKDKSKEIDELIKEETHLNYIFFTVGDNEDINNKIKLLKSMYIDGDIDREDYEKKLHNLSKQKSLEIIRKREVKARLEQINKELEQLVSPETLQIEDDVSDTYKKKIVDLCIKKINLEYIMKDNKKLRLITLNDEYRFIYNEWIKTKHTPNVYVVNENKHIRL